MQYHDSRDVEQAELREMRNALAHRVSKYEQSGWLVAQIAGQTALVARSTGRFSIPNIGEDDGLLEKWKAVYLHYHHQVTTPVVSVRVLGSVNGRQGLAINDEQCPVYP